MNAQTMNRPTDLPHVWQDEDGCAYYAEGRIDAWRFVLACVVDTATQCGHEEAMEMLTGPQRWSSEDGRERAAELVGAVDHLWYRPVVEDEERMEPCGPGDDGAMQFTKLAL